MGTSSNITIMKSEGSAVTDQDGYPTFILKVLANTQKRPTEVTQQDIEQAHSDRFLHLEESDRPTMSIESPYIGGDWQYEINPETGEIKVYQEIEKTELVMTDVTRYQHEKENKDILWIAVQRHPLDFCKQLMKEYQEAEAEDIKSEINRLEALGYFIDPC